MNTPREISGGDGRSATVHTVFRWRRLNLILAGLFAFAFVAGANGAVGPAQASVRQSAIAAANGNGSGNNGSGNNGNGNNGNGNNGNGNDNGDGGGKKTTTTTRPTTTTTHPPATTTTRPATTTTHPATTTTRPATTTTHPATTTTKPCKDVDSKKYPPKPCKPKCNSGRGNGSEKKDSGDEDCDPGNSGGHNNGGD